MLVIPWNFKEEILSREQNFIQNGGKMLFLMPKPYIVDNNGEYLIKVILDRNNVVVESKENNNVAEFILVVAEPEKEDFVQSLIDEGRLTVEGGAFKGKRITFHDPCYLGRANNIFEAPRSLINSLDAELVEMKRCKTRGLCCGAGGAQMFKEPEKGDKDINIERTEEALTTKPEIIATGCPFCNTMMTDGIKNKEKEAEVKVLDLAEMIATAADIID